MTQGQLNFWTHIRGFPTWFIGSVSSSSGRCLLEREGGDLRTSLNFLWTRLVLNVLRQFVIEFGAATKTPSRQAEG